MIQDPYLLSTSMTPSLEFGAENHQYLTQSTQHLPHLRASFLMTQPLSFITSPISAFPTSSKHSVSAPKTFNALSCLTHRSREVTDRHNFVVDAIERHYRMAGDRTWKEPTKQGKRDNSRPDLKAFEPVGTLLTDVSVTHPLAPSNLAKANQDPLAWSGSRAEIKCNGHDCC